MGGERKETIYGRHPVYEALVAGRRRFFRIILAEHSQEKGIIAALLRLARSKKIPLHTSVKSSLDQVSDHHQGVLAEVSSYPYVELGDIASRAEKSGRAALVLLLDIFQNPQNLGTLFRTAEAVGVQGIVLPQKRAAAVTPAVVSASAGASEHLWVAQANLTQAMRLLKDKGLWIAGLDLGPQALSLGQADLSGPLGLVVGGEEKGIRPLVRQSCDYLLKIPMHGKVASLNASVAGSIALYMIWQARGFSEENDA